MTVTIPDPFEFLDRPVVSRVLFHPRRDRPDRPVPLRVRALRIPVDAGIEISARLHRADPEGPTILLFHGNGEIASDYDGISPLYTNLGINLLVVDYRGYGSSDGTPQASYLLADALAVHKKTRALLIEHNLRVKPLYVMGRSLGSAAAIEIAQYASAKTIEPPIAGLIIESGFAYTLPLLVTLGLHSVTQDIKNEADGFDHRTKIAQIDMPTLIIHGEQDQLIPIKHGRALFEHSGAEDKRFVPIPKAGHNDLLFTGQTTYFEALRRFIFGGKS
jgi:pimeloyl-ACP methyl ester carboxylesterase